MSKQDDLLLIRNLVITIFKTNGLLIETGNSLVHNAGLTAAWWQVLGALGYSTEPLPVARIARNMGLTRQAVQRIVNLLEERGFVALEENPHHQRAKLVVLTSAGRVALKAAEAAEAPLNRRLLNKIGAERVAIAMAVLTEMNEVIARASDASTRGIENKQSKKDKR